MAERSAPAGRGQLQGVQMSMMTKMMGTAACAVIGLVGFAAEIGEGTVTLKTYPFSDPDPVPAATEKRYPYFRFDGSSAEGRPQTFRTVHLENGKVALDLLPEVGGKVWGATDKASGLDFIYRNHAAKFRNIAMRGPWWSGGIEFNFGIIGHSPCTSTPVDCAVRTNADGSVSCFVSMTEFICRTTYQVEVRLGKDDDHFTTRTLWFNSSGLPSPYYHWMNSASPVSDDMILKFDGRQAIGHQGEAQPWPVDGEGHRLSVYAENAFGHNKSYHVINGDNRVFGVWYPSKDVGFVHENESYDKYGRKVWIWALSREGAIWEDLLTDSDGQYVELQSGRAFNQPRFDTVRTPFKHPTFSPGRTDAFVEKWGVFRRESDYEPRGTNPPSAARPRAFVSPEDFDWNGVYGHFLRGQQALREREDGLGENELLASLKLDPNFVPALDELAFLMIRRGRYAEARDLAEHSLSVDTYGGAANYAAGFAAKLLGDFATAKERLGLASYAAEYRNAAYALLARIAVAERDCEQALALVSRVLASDAANRDALLVRTIALRLSGCSDEAKSAAEAALEVWPLYFAAMYEAGLNGGEKPDFRKIVRNEFPSETLLEIASWYRETGLEDDARTFERAAGECPLAKIRLGDYDAAAKLPLPSIFPFRREDVEALDRAVAAHPSWKFKYYRAALAKSFQDDATANRLMDAIGETADEWSFYVFRAGCRTGAARLADLRKAETLSHDWRIGRALAAYFAEEKKWDESATEAKRFLGWNPGSNPLQIALARALNGAGHWRESVEFLKGVNILPSEFGDNACDFWQEAWRALGDEKMAETYPENLGKGKPYVEK